MTAPAAAAAAPVTAGCAVGTFLADEDDRSGAVPLAGQTVVGDVHVFAEAVAALDTVTFTLTGPDGVERTVVERVAPWDLATTGDGERARPLRTAGLADGTYTVRTAWAYAGASATACAQAPRSATATFVVAGAPACRPNLLVSDGPARRDARPLSGETLAADAHVFLDAPTRPRQELSRSTAVVDRVTFVLYRFGQQDGGYGRIELLQRVEAHPPFDLLGTRPDGRARPLRLDAWGPGTYVVTVEWTLTDRAAARCGEDVPRRTGAIFTILEED